MIEQQRQQRRPPAGFPLGYKRPRPASISVFNSSPTVAATISPTVAATVGQKMSYNRALSPGGKRIHHPARASDSFAVDSYYGTGNGGNHRNSSSYISPRTSAGVIPLSSQTYVNTPASSVHHNSRPAERFDSYSGRPRRSSTADQYRGSTAPAIHQPGRSRPTIIQNDIGRPSSPIKGSREKDYLAAPTAPSKATEHKKVYSVDDGKAKLVADVDTPAVQDSHRQIHKRRDSVERTGYKGSGLTVDGDRHRDRSRRIYYPSNGYNVERGRNGKSVEDEDAYSYTDAAGMYRDTEPRWRAEQRPRRGSLDRGGASRERSSTLDATGPYGNPRLSAKDISSGPPVSTRGWNKIGDGVGRTSSLRDPPPRVAQSPNRGRYLDVRDPYQASSRGISREGRPRDSSRDNRSLALYPERPTHVDRYADPYASESELLRDPRASGRDRRSSLSRRADASVERRGFGIRAGSKDRAARGSDEDLGKQRRPYRDSGYAEPSRRETAPPEMASAYQQYDREKRNQSDLAYGRDYSDRSHGRERER
ncbi:hypothetical protein KC318_g4401, partial [Hortaea werneckii]